MNPVISFMIALLAIVLSLTFQASGQTRIMPELPSVRQHAEDSISPELFSAEVETNTAHNHPVVAGLFGEAIKVLNLTAVQENEIATIFNKAINESLPLMMQITKEHEQLTEQAFLSQPEDAELRRLAQQESEALTQLTIRQVQTKAKIYQVLNPEQRIAFENYLRGAQEATPLDDPNIF